MTGKRLFYTGMGMIGIKFYYCMPTFIYLEAE